jgi:hypothetical protein
MPKDSRIPLLTKNIIITIMSLIVIILLEISALLKMSILKNHGHWSIYNEPYVALPIWAAITIILALLGLSIAKKMKTLKMVSSILVYIIIVWLIYNMILIIRLP